jgi:ATP-binding cassette subfamily B protein
MNARPAITITHIRQRDEDEVDQRPLDWGMIRRLLRYMRPHARTRNWLLALVSIRAIQLPSLAWAIGAVINGPIARHDPTGTLHGALAFAALAAVTDFCFHFRQRLALQLGEAIIRDLRQEIYEHLHRLPMSFFSRTKVGRVISRMTSDAEAVREGMQNAVFISMVQGGQMIFAALLMAWTDGRLFLVVLAMAPVMWALNRYFRKRLIVAWREVQEAWSRVTSTIAESVSGIRVTQGFVRQDVNASVFRRLIEEQSGYNVGVARSSAVFLPLLELNSQFFIAILLLLGGYRVLAHDSHTPVGTLIQFFFLANLFFSPIQILGDLYNRALTAMAGAERVFRFLDTKPEWTDPPEAAALPPIRGRVEFRGVTFGYDADVPVLHDINFIAEPGQTVALVGHTGGGKSSIINLIAKFYLPNDGAVLIDGVDTRTIQTDSLHRQMGIVQQQNFLFSGTVLDNIRFGKPDATVEEAVEVARKLDCLDLIGALPRGLETEVGERGIGLSLGQRQLICFCRAMIANPRILILDEATSSVDAMTEARIQKSLATLLQGRTSFVVAHRLSTIRHASIVLVLDRGRIIERGTHTQLLRARGKYAHLYRQFIRATTEA